MLHDHVIRLCLETGGNDTDSLIDWWQGSLDMGKGICSEIGFQLSTAYLLIFYHPVNEVQNPTASNQSLAKGHFWTADIFGKICQHLNTERSLIKIEFFGFPLITERAGQIGLMYTPVDKSCNLQALSLHTPNVFARPRLFVHITCGSFEIRGV